MSDNDIKKAKEQDNPSASSQSDRITDEMLRSSDIPVEVEFQRRLDDNIKKAGYTGPARVFGADLVATLFGILVDALKGCLGQQSREKIVKKVRKPSAMQRSEIRSRIASRIFQGTKNYEKMGGQQVYQGLFMSINQSSDAELHDLLDYTYEERLPDPTNEPVNYGRLT